MAKNFDKMNKGKIANIAKKSSEQANLITIKYYQNKDIIDCPDNNEDLSHTEDLETAIKELGFTDPIEITDTFEFEKTEDDKYIAKENEGKYMILSGHRRRRAGTNLGMDKFPCILRHFDKPSDMRNYILMSNAQRNVDNDPLLYATRYLMHDEYLDSIGFKGSKREEIAKRMGVTVAHADRYKQLNKVIMPIIDLVRAGKLGMSSVTDTGLYTHGEEEQKQIKSIFDAAIEDDVNLTRENVKKIIEGFRNGKRTWNEIEESGQEEEALHPEEEQHPEDESWKNGVSVMKINTEPEETKEDTTSPLRNNEINYDFSHREGEEHSEMKPDYEDFEPLDTSEKEEEEEKENVSKTVKNGEKISKYMEHLETLLNDFYDFDEKDAALNVKAMGTLASMLITEMSENAYKYDCMETFKMTLKEIKKDVKRVDV